MAVPPRELHRIVPTVIVYNDEGKYLIVKRSNDLKVYPGRWVTPGGGLSMDDYDHLPSTTKTEKQWYFVLENALRREVREEISIEIGKPEYLLDFTFVRPDGVPVLALVYYASYREGEIKTSDEIVDHAWVTLEEAKTYDIIEGIYGEIEMVEKRLKKS